MAFNIKYSGKIVQEFDDVKNTFTTSDLGIAAAVLSSESKPKLIDTILEKEDGSRYLFVISGNVGVMKDVVLAWFAGTSILVDAKEYFYNERVLKQVIAEKRNGQNTSNPVKP